VPLPPPLTDAQREVVDARPGPLRVLGGFGCGTSFALRARRDALVAAGRTALLVSVDRLVELAMELVPSARRRVMTTDEQRNLVARLTDHEDPADVDELARTVVLYQASWLGAEELFTHADAAGELEVWTDLVRFTDGYLAELRRVGVHDRASALVDATIALRDPGVLAQARRAFDDLLVDDFQNADFAANRFVTQLCGRNGSLTVGGNIGAAVGSEWRRTPKYLETFVRRFDAADVVLDEVLRPRAPLQVRSAAPASHGAHVISRTTVDSEVGREWPVVVIEDAVDGVWPSPRPRHRRFDPHLLSGPDVPDDDEREARWLAEERRRFDIASTRATQATIVVEPSPPEELSPFVAELDA